MSSSKGVGRFIESQRVARMATVDAVGSPHIVPICYAYDGFRLFSVVDDKPKRVERSGLRRLVNIRGNPRVCVIFDDYDEDWGRLRFVVIHGTAQITIEGPQHRHAVSLLREKYPQYRTMGLDEGVHPVIVIAPRRIVSWGPFD